MLPTPLIVNKLPTVYICSFRNILSFRIVERVKLWKILAQVLCKSTNETYILYMEIHVNIYKTINNIYLQKYRKTIKLFIFSR